eukprot:gene3115-biopygen5208
MGPTGGSGALSCNVTYRRQWGVVVQWDLPEAGGVVVQWGQPPCSFCSGVVVQWDLPDAGGGGVVVELDPPEAGGPPGSPCWQRLRCEPRDWWDGAGSPTQLRLEPERRRTPRTRLHAPTCARMILRRLTVASSSQSKAARAGAPAVPVAPTYEPAPPL